MPPACIGKCYGDYLDGAFPDALPGFVMTFAGTLWGHPLSMSLRPLAARHLNGCP